MAKGNLNREDYKSAIPQLSAKLNQILNDNVIFDKKVITLENEVQQNNQDFAYFRNLSAGYIEAIAGDFQYLSSHEAYFDHLTAEIIDSDEINANFLHTTFANIDHADIDIASIGTLFNEVGLIDSATIVDGHITGFLDAVQINAASITAGTLITNRLLLSGTASGNTSVLYELNNLGQLTSQNVDSLDGYVLTPRTVNADRIVASSITANEIAANTITASKIAANTITANNIKANTITANEIAANTITASQIAANTITASQIAANTITASQIAANTITASQIASNTITANELSVANINVGVFNQGTHRSVTVDSNYPKSYTYAAAASYVGLMSDSWSHITDIGSGTWSVGDLVSIPFTISDRNNAQAYMVCRIKSYSGSTLTADNLSIVTDPESSQYMSFDANGLRVYSGNKDNASYNTSYVQIKNTGIDIVSGSVTRANFSGSGVTLYDDVGNTVAVFGESVRLGHYAANDFCIDLFAGSGDPQIFEARGGIKYIYDQVVRATSHVEMIDNFPNPDIPCLYHEVQNGCIVLKTNGGWFILDSYGRMRLETSNNDGNNNGSSITVTSTNGTGSASLHVGSGGTNHGLYSRTHDGWIIYANSSGQAIVPMAAPGGNTNKALYITADGRLTTSSSSRSVKECIGDISDKSLDPARLYDLRVVQFRYKKLEEGSSWGDGLLPGFIAEEVLAAYPKAACADGKGGASDWEPRHIIPPMLKLIQDQKKQIDSLKEKVNQLYKEVV